MNAQTKDEIVRELIDDLEAEQGSALPPAQRQEIADVLQDYLETLAETLRKS